MEIFPCSKYEMKLSGCTAELVIHNAEPEDASDYTCDTGDQQSTAILRVNGQHCTKMEQRIKGICEAVQITFCYLW